VSASQSASPLPSPLPSPSIPPLGQGFRQNLRFDAVAGFLVFLIAMPLCLAIARASGYPPIAGIWTAVIGGIMCTFLSNSELTIKGPAAGLIVIVFGAVSELGNEFGAGKSDAEKALLGYRLALGIGVTAGVIQIIFGLIRAGKLIDFFPLTPVHGMLAAIGVIIISKQVYEVIGVAPKKGAGPLDLLSQLPSAIGNLNPEIAAIGLVSLVILFGFPFIPFKAIGKMPAQLFVLIVAIGLGFAFDLDHQHTYLFPSHFFDSENPDSFEVGPRFLVEMPHVLEDPSSAFAWPLFDGLATQTGLTYLLLFSLIGSLESLLSAKAVELLDPWRRKTNFNRDLLAVGLANTLASAVGALPMISEIVRSKANLDNGARTRYANGFHGLFLLAFVLLFPGLIHQIPLAALGAMLVYTGFRLASPKEFVRTYRVGSEQFIVFVGTVLATLATDLLIGIGVGVALKILFHIWNGVPLKSFLKADVDVVSEGDELAVIVVKRAAIFSNWLGMRDVILKQAETRNKIIVDLSLTKLVDHSVMEKLNQLEQEFHEVGKELSVIGLEEHTPMAKHPLSARKNRSPKRSGEVAKVS